MSDGFQMKWAKNTPPIYYNGKNRKIYFIEISLDSDIKLYTYNVKEVSIMRLYRVQYSK